VSSSTNAKTRSERAANLGIDRYPWKSWVSKISTWESAGRLGIAVFVAILIMLFVRAWEPPFAYRQGFVPQRAILARVPFQVVDEVKTEVLKTQAAREVYCVYENRSEPISQLRGAIKDSLFSLRDVADPLTLTKQQIATLDLLGVSVLDPDQAPISHEVAIDAIRKTLATDADTTKFDAVMREVLDPIIEKGMLKSLAHDLEMGNQRYIRVVPAGLETPMLDADVQSVRVSEVTVTLRGSLQRKFENLYERDRNKEALIIAQMIHNYLAPRLPATLTLRDDLSNKARQEAINAVKPATISFDPGFGAIVPLGKVLGEKEISLLRAEHTAYTKQLTWQQCVQRLAAFGGLITALCLLCGFFIHQSIDKSLISDTLRLIHVLGVCSGCIIVAVLAARDPLRAEVAPVTLTAIIATIAFGRPAALLLMAALSLLISFSTRVDLSEFIMLASASAGSVLLCGRIRNRTRLIYVGLGVAVVVFFTVLGLGVMTGQTGGVVTDGPAMSSLQSTTSSLFPVRLLSEATWQATLVLACGPLMAGLLPVFEKLLDVQTDLRLLELSDMSHPLLRQLAQRAPGTYNHSISVAALAETAAEAIGANGLLVRVGACFHDIGKMFKPNYFVENQSPGTNRHDTLQPAMSTLIIIAHVKDGADLGRQHRLPRRIIDFIEQHHGTTLVEYFFRLAMRKSEQDPNADEVPENAFRYPGPKPQTREAAVLMIADAVESASRALVEPTPSRLQNLVDQIAMKKLLDGQFEDCALTLKELDLIKNSLVKSLTAIYHGRIKYPDQQTAG
jgi:putative nucleotidyltransferase with HDIG domain